MPRKSLVELNPKNIPTIARPCGGPKLVKVQCGGTFEDPSSEHTFQYTQEDVEERFQKDLSKKAPRGAYAYALGECLRPDYSGEYWQSIQFYENR
ncbi:MAG TPA: hypothetical protein VI933_00160 [archaeon]|nr:hypothetical protein [archaeon]